MTNELLVILVIVLGPALLIAILHIQAARRLQKAFERFDNSLNQILDDADAEGEKPAS